MEIKYRAWDKDNKKMLQVKSIHFTEGQQMIVINPLEFISSDHVILMQDTGLEDKHQSGIYAGDITELNLEDGEVRRFLVEIGEIEREIVVADGFCDDTQLIRTKAVYFIYTDEYGEQHELLPCVDENGVSDVEKMVAIGNIYENPELLGVENEK